MLSIILAVASSAADTTTVSADAPPPGPSSDVAAEHLLDFPKLHSDPTILWPGFLNGLRGFENFYNPVGNPLYFETPLNNTECFAGWTPVTIVV